MASPATAAATTSTTSARFGRTPRSMTTPSSTGIVTVITASSAAARRKIASCRRYGRAYPAILRTVPRFSCCLVTDESDVNPRIIWSWPGPGCIAAGYSRRPRPGTSLRPAHVPAHDHERARWARGWGGGLPRACPRAQIPSDRVTGKRILTYNRGHEHRADSAFLAAHDPPGPGPGLLRGHPRLRARGRHNDGPGPAVGPGQAARGGDLHHAGDLVPDHARRGSQGHRAGDRRPRRRRGGAPGPRRGHRRRRPGGPLGTVRDLR